MQDLSERMDSVLKQRQRRNQPKSNRPTARGSSSWKRGRLNVRQFLQFGRYGGPVSLGFFTASIRTMEASFVSNVVVPHCETSDQQSLHDIRISSPFYTYTPTYKRLEDVLKIQHPSITVNRLLHLTTPSRSSTYFFTTFLLHPPPYTRP